MGRRKRKKAGKVQIFAALIVLVLGAVSSFVGKEVITEDLLYSTKELEGLLNIYYLDVGQGDSTYIELGEVDILIDAGPKSEGDKLMEQLDAFNIDDFEIIIATHPHEDHIGGMKKIFEKYDVEEFYMPKVTHSSKTFEEMIKAINNEGIKVKTIKGGMNLNLGSGAYIDVFSPIYESYNNLNNYSPIMKLSFGENSFMFTGDAELEIEKEVVNKYKGKLKSDVLKFGHHGSSTSSNESFVQAVNPSYGVISSGANNSYGHPHKEILALITKYKIETYRTDTDGQITITSDGRNITVQK